MSWSIKLQPWQREQIVKASLDGEKNEVLAARYGISSQYVGQLRKEAGHPRQPWRPKISKADMASFANLSLTSHPIGTAAVIG